MTSQDRDSYLYKLFWREHVLEIDTYPWNCLRHLVLYRIGNLIHRILNDHVPHYPCLCRECELARISTNFDFVNHFLFKFVISFEPFHVLVSSWFVRLVWNYWLWSSSKNSKFLQYLEWSVFLKWCVLCCVSHASRVQSRVAWK